MANLYSHDIAHLRISTTNLDAPAEVQVVSATTGSSYVAVFKSVRTQLFVCMTKAYTTYVGGNPRVWNGASMSQRTYGAVSRSFRVSAEV